MSVPEPPPFELETREQDGRLVLAPHGELDLATCSQVEDAALAAVREGRHVVLDLRGLEFMDSSGVRVLVSAHAAAQEHGGARVSIVPGTAEVSRVLEISGLLTRLDVVDGA